MMTTVTGTVTVPQRGKTEDDSALYESPSAHIIEETEYVKKIRTTLEKIRNQIFRDEVRHSSTNHKLDAKCCGNIQNGSDSAVDSSCGSLDLLMERIKEKDLQLLEMNKENEVLKIKLEASREAGAAALRNAAQRLLENYQTRSEEVRKKHEDRRHLLQVDKLEKEQKLKQHVENLDQIAEKLEEKHKQITELENLVQRMEKLPGSSKGDFPPPGADLTSAVCDSLPASEPAQCHPGGQVNQVCFSGRWYVYSEKTKYTRLVWTLQLRSFSPLTFPFYSHETWLSFQCPLLSLCPHL
ncbi:coiled-coil domain-containing protein 68 isoform X2 [Ovis aries]|uniref:coiled-coil domain-containing protein 68 isoform X2 n=1 Tax=Ovis aries TaxID=9940 RepID=UPI001C2E5376|nr:coiled-coil domain-containing protein 68 isoform X2 [Ovis aries]XP_060261275.1 coiled-coil domain-containing protein 68 isoform X2 [Ovis aries]